MRRPPRMAAAGHQHAAHRPVGGHRIRGRHDAAERTAPSASLRSTPRARRWSSPGTLHVVEAVLVGLPDVDLGAGDRLAIGDATCASTSAARRVRRPRCRRPSQARRVVDVERPEHRGLGRARRGLWFMRDGEHRQPSVSDSRMNSCRLSSHFWPVAVRKRMPCIHSASVSRTSRAKSCRWRTSAPSISFRRGLSQSSKPPMTASVMVCSSMLRIG